MSQGAKSPAPELVRRLPTELEQIIFELTARAHPGSAVNLVMVAHRIQLWVEAIIYETLVFEFPQKTLKLFLQTLNARPASFFAANVKNIYLPSIVPFAQAKRILAVCGGVTNLACWAEMPFHSENLLSIIPTKTLERLSVKLGTLWGGFTPQRPLFSEMFSHLSHLDIVNPTGHILRMDWSWLYELPALTHLSFGDLFEEDVQMFILIEDLLSTNQSLETLVTISSDPLFTREYEVRELNDPRLVHIPSFHHPKSMPDYWRDIRRGEPDFWAVCDEMVEKAKKRSTEVMSSSRAGEHCDLPRAIA